MPFPILLDCSHTPYSRLKPVPINSIKLQPGFWADRMQTIKSASLQMQYEFLEKTGRLDNFRRINNQTDEPYRGYFFNDSDVFKWLEAACWSSASGLDERSQDRINEVIDIISAAQDRDGYLNSYFSGAKRDERWTNLRDMHELYCAGHLIQAAIAHYRVSEHDRFLTVAVDLADHICRRFLDSGLPGTPGHPEIEMALVELYRTVSDRRYLRMAQSFLDQRGFGVIGGSAYHLDRIPFRELRKLEGHAVRAMYLCCGATDIYLETGEILLLETLKNLWVRMVSKQMYITGGVGSRHQGEALGDDFELPNSRAYAETCAAIGSVMWNWRMLHAFPDDSNHAHFQPEVKYADQIEWTLFNAVLPGISLDGQEYHYVNPLAVFDKHERTPWFDCACCPTNILRLIASIGGYLLSRTENNIWIHQYASNTSEIHLNAELTISLSIITDYPWNGCVEIELLSIKNSDSEFEKDISQNIPRSFGINLRIPTWLQATIPIQVNNSWWHLSGKPGSYLKIEREWMIGDKVRFEFPLNTLFIECHPFVNENTDRVVVTRGPLLYCIEAEDNPSIDPREVCLNLGGTYEVRPMKILSEDIAGIQTDGVLNSSAAVWKNHLYLETQLRSIVQNEKIEKLLAIPYFTWGNRTNRWMQVWLSKR